MLRFWTAARPPPTAPVFDRRLHALPKDRYKAVLEFKTFPLELAKEIVTYFSCENIETEAAINVELQCVKHTEDRDCFSVTYSDSKKIERAVPSNEKRIELKFRIPDGVPTTSVTDDFSMTFWALIVSLQSTSREFAFLLPIYG